MLLPQVQINIIDRLRTQAGAGNFTIIEDLGCYVSSLAGLLLTIGGLGAFLYFVWGGINWITAGHDQTKVDEAKTRITNAVIGLAVIAASWAVFRILDYFFGLGLADASGTCGGTSAPIPPRGNLPAL